MTAAESSQPAFLPRPPLSKALDLANLDLRDKITASELAWLYEHPVTWLQALAQLKTDVQSHIHKSRLSIAALKPTSGTAPSHEYLVAKQREDSRQVKMCHFLEKVGRRAAEVSSLFGYDRRDMVSNAHLVVTLVRVENALEDGDSDKAADLLAYLLDSLEVESRSLNDRSV